MWRKGNTSALLVGTHSGAATVENSMEFPWKTKNGTAFDPRKKELIPFATAWMEQENIMLTEISQVVREKYHMISPLTGT